MIELILSTAKYLGVSGQLLLAICTHESGLVSVYVSNDGGTPSYGVCQLKYSTAKMLGFKGKPKELMTPKTNIKYAAKYLKYQQDRYGNDWISLASSYNAGSYLPSKKVKGCPVNRGYLKLVQKKLSPNLKYKLNCEKIYHAS